MKRENQGPFQNRGDNAFAFPLMHTQKLEHELMRCDDEMSRRVFEADPVSKGCISVHILMGLFVNTM